jgi:hypothetical protein
MGALIAGRVGPNDRHGAQAADPPFVVKHMIADTLAGGPGSADRDPAFSAR